MKAKRLLAWLLCSVLAFALLPAGAYADVECNLIIRYQYTDGTEAAPTHSETLSSGTPYSVTSPVIQYYTPSQATVSGNLDSDVDVTVIYTINTHTIVYVVNNQFYRAFSDVACNTPLTELAEPTQTDARFSGWSWNTANGEMPATMPDTDLLVMGTFSYKWNIRFVDSADSTKTVKDTAAYYVPYNTVMMASIGNLSVTGYTLVPGQPGVDSILGTVHLLTPMTSAGYTTNILYNINSYDLTIQYQYADGSEAAPTHAETLTYGTPYSVASPTILNYTPSQATVSGNLESNVDVTVTYAVRKITYYVSRTLTDAATGISASGLIDSNARLTVNNHMLHNEQTCSVCDEIRSLMSDADTLTLFYGDISLSSGFTGTLNLSIPVGVQYNGQTVTILHCNNGRLETISAIVASGTVTFTAADLSPFAVTAGSLVPDTEVINPPTSDAETQSDTEVINPPKTGDAGAPWSFALITLAAVCLGCMVIIRRKA